jgi:hypothetical protein
VAGFVETYLSSTPISDQ